MAKEQKKEEYQPGEFEDIELPIEPMPEEEAEFEEPELEMAAVGIYPPIEELIAAKEKLEQQLIFDTMEQSLSAESDTELHGFKNIVGVGISEKVTHGHQTGKPCVTVYVVAKVNKDEIEAEALVPEEIDGTPVDVVEIGEIHALPFKGRYRPAPGGVSVGHYKITAGTLGCLARRANALYILSNNHVLADCNRARIGDPILQPGPIDGGKVPADVIAKLSQFVPIKFGGPANQVDCAIAQASPKLVNPLNKCFGRISSTPLPCKRNLLVKKCGRTTQFTRGRITDCNFTGKVNYGTAGIALFQNQIIAVSLTSQPFSAGGDSGSLIVSDVGNRPVGLLFAGSATHTIGNPISNVLKALNVTIVA